MESKTPPGLLEISEMQYFVSMGHSTSCNVISDAGCIFPYARSWQMLPLV